VLTHNVPFVTGILPQIKVTAEKQIRIIRRILRGSTRNWSRAMIADLREMKGVLFEMITVTEMAQRYTKTRDYASAFDYASDLKDYAHELLGYMEEYDG
jgi:hypothetical protein